MPYQRRTLAAVRRDGRPRSLSMLTDIPASLATSRIFATVSRFRCSVIVSKRRYRFLPVPRTSSCRIVW